MDEIKVGEYVRTIDGLIGIFVKYSSRKDASYYKSHFNCFIKLQKRKTDLQCCREYIVKHKFNIIELIEIGDIVFIETEGWLDGVYVDNEEMLEAVKEDIKEGCKIKTILTHEQYERNCYKM